MLGQLGKVREGLPRALDLHRVDPLPGEHHLLLDGGQSAGAAVPLGAGGQDVLGVVLHDEEQVAVMAPAGVIVVVATSRGVKVGEDWGEGLGPRVDPRKVGRTRPGVVCKEK